MKINHQSIRTTHITMHIVIILTIVIIVVLTLCYSIISQVVLIIFLSSIHANTRELLEYMEMIVVIV